MALFQHIEETYITYSGRFILQNSRLKKTRSVFTIDKCLKIDLICHITHGKYIFQKYNQRNPIESTDDIRWILMKLYND